MKRKLALASLAICLSAAATIGRAETTPAPDPAPGSAYLRCDGSPASWNAGQEMGRVLVIMATMGLSGSMREWGDTSKRLEGDAGAEACTEALAKETNEIRRVQLILARAAHEIEAKKYQAALDDARSAPAAAPSKADDVAFKRTLLVSSQLLEAAAVLGLGRPAEAEAIAIKAAQPWPYDLVVLTRAGHFVGLTAEMPPAKREFYEHFERLMPSGLRAHAVADQWAGDYAHATAVYQAFLDLQSGFIPDMPPGNRAVIAVTQAMAGDMTASDATAAAMRAELEQAAKSADAVSNASGENNSEELLDFQVVIHDASAGRLAEARAAFAARSRWVVPAAPTVATMTERLRLGASQDELKGALARDPDTIRKDALAAYADAALTVKPGARSYLYDSILPYLNVADYGRLSRAVWKGEKSPYFAKRTGKEKYQGEYILVPTTDAASLAVVDAMLLHCAVVARARGKSGFVFALSRNLNSSIVRFGEPGEPGFPRQAFVNAADVIAALSSEMPDPATTH